MRPRSPTVFGPEDHRVRRLMRSDSAIRQLVGEVGTCELRLHENAFVGLARPIVGQQLSGTAARSIWSRLRSELGGGVSASRVLDVGETRLLSTGMSRNKAAYLVGIARAASEGELDFAGFEAQSDDQVIDRLSQFKGVGRWTAEMFLVFCLGRMDVFSAQDGGLRRAMLALYGWGNVDEPSTRMAEASDAWRPNRTVGCLYLWRALDMGLLRQQQCSDLPEC